jgi:AraC-like DNA-binding protein
MNTNYLVLLFGAGIAQGLFLVVVLVFLDVRNRAASRLLAALLAVITIMIMGIFLDRIEAASELNGGLAVEFAIGPLVFLFAKAIRDGQFQFGIETGLHFVPFGLALLILIVVSWSFGGGFSSGNSVAVPYIQAWTILKIPYFFIYAGLAHRELTGAISTARRRHLVQLHYLRTWFLAMYFLVGVLYAYFVLSFFGVKLPLDPDVTGGVLLILAIFSLAYFVISNRGLLDTNLAIKGDSDELVQLAKRHLEEFRPFTDPDYAFGELALAIGTEERVLSQALLAYYDGGFNELLNIYRILAFDSLIKDPSHMEASILELAFDAGFNSKATFYRAFKSIKETTPTAYRKELLKSDDI